jgi:flavin reductase (DIM6/NTAB) family NADH-FMN oxidoreductase RutF
MSSDSLRVTGAEFRRACGRFATGVSIATVLDATGAPHGLTVSSFTSVSLEPPLVLVCLGLEVTNLQLFRAATYFGINVLAADQQALSERFARKGEDRFDGLAWDAGATGVPLIPGCLARIECRLYRRLEMGDHDIFIGEMLHADVADGNPLIYFSSTYRTLESL